VRDRAAAVHRRAREAVWQFRFDRGEALLHQALRLLDEASGGAETTALRVQTLVTLSYAEAEARSLAVGLARLDTTAEYLARLVDGPERAALDGLVLSNRALLVYRAGQVLEGLELFDRAVPQLRTGLRSGRGDPVVLAHTYLNRGVAHIDLVQPDAATQDFRRCVEVCERYGLAQIAAKARHNMGYVAYMSGDMPAALTQYAAAASTLAEIASSLLPVGRVDHARALLAAGLPERAAEQLEDAIPQLRKQRAGQDLAEAEVTMAAAALLDGKATEARRWARSAERLFTRRGNTRWAAVAALAALRAEAAQALSRGHVPRRLPERAVKLADMLRPLLLEDETGLALMLAIRLELRRGDPAAAEILLDQLPRRRATTPLDHRMLLRLCRAELAVARGDRRRALAEARSGLAELGRARDRMGGLELVCGTAIHGEELGDLAVRLVLDGPRRTARQLFGWLERTRAQVYRYEPLPTIDDPVVAEQVTELRSLRRAAQLARLSGRAPRREEKQIATLERTVLRQGWYTSPWGRPRPVASLSAVQAALGSRALVTFAVSGDELVALIVAGGRTRLARLASATETFEWVKRLHADLDTYAPNGLPAPIAAVVGGSARRSADLVDTRLIVPLLRFIGDRELVIVPTGPLYAVAWGSLPSLRGRPVVVAPSATAWLTAYSVDSSPGPPILVRGPLLREEIAEDSAVAATYPQAVRLAGSSATASAVLAALDGASVAHLAAHGEHEPTNAMFSRLELADGPLFAHELARLSHPPRHVVLAACELAMHHIRPGDEALGFAGALLASGVRTVIAANSRVGDKAAAVTMADYHARIAVGDPPAVALAAAVAVDPLRRPFICLGAS